MTLCWSSEKTRERYQCRACGSWFSRHKVKCPHRPLRVGRDPRGGSARTQTSRLRLSTSCVSYSPPIDGR